MSVNIKFEIKGVFEVNKRINKIIDNYKDLTPAWKKIGKDFRITEDRVFRGQGSYGSRGGWTPLSEKYQAWKSQNFPGKPILQMTGKLKNSLTRKGANHIEIIRPKSITLGSGDPKFKFHQKGTRKMTARPPITITRYQCGKWTKIIRDTLMEGDNK